MWPSDHSSTQLFTVTTIIRNTDGAFLGEFREVEYESIDLADCLDAVTKLIWQGYDLHAVTLSDRYGQLRLPVDSFDGLLFTQALWQLERDWDAVLATTPSRSA